MYDKTDPRASLAPAAARKAPIPTQFAGAELGLFYDSPPQQDAGGARTWITRGQNLIVAYSECRAGAELARSGQPDEYALILPEKETAVEITTAEGTQTVPGYSIAFLPPGDSSIRVVSPGRLVRVFSPATQDLARAAGNAASFAAPHPNVAEFRPWPAPPGGFRLRWYSLDQPKTEGRFGRIFRCTTIMINFLDPRVGPRDRTKVSPHHHDDFEQCSLALDGLFVHHLRWPWTPDMNIWRDDEHIRCETPSVCIIPPPAVHTSTSEDPGLNQLVDIFAPPRLDFSMKPGWVINEADYPMPAAS